MPDTAHPIRTASARTAVRTFVRAYLAQHDDSPSIGEIAAALRSTKPHVTRVLDGLERDGELVRLRAGPRRKGRIILPEQQARALALLTDLGWSINGDVKAILARAA